MNHHGFRALAVCAALASLAAGCTQAPDLSAARAEAQKPLQRYDAIQALAAHGDKVAAGTRSGAVLVSSDGGRSWNRQSIAGPSSITGIDVCPDGRFIAIDFYRKVWTADARLSAWTAQPLEAPHTALAVHCDLRGRWWVAGSGALIVRSDDQGKSWAKTDLQEDLQLTTVQMVDELNGFATGEFGTVVVTTDGGATWAKRGALPEEFYPYAALFVSASEGWVTGLAGQVVHTTDGGLSWTAQVNRANAPLYRIFMHAGAPHAVGAGGAVVRLQGEEWVAVAYPDARPVPLAAGTSVAANNTLLIGGPGGLLRAIADGGSSKPGAAK
ncbi:WD40/YVTN/BNR-like repeat-containing protein [Methyloversatilis discipulorum]|uniref:WD40/YVTN/BNR-like repeat-containing protein n=1 Tax=Methyloversatilis discipulorum TaxID=1119528 RepID=UPI001A3B7299|nr:YCF48-related protein [Methyloversatilis discipulorum]MBL8469056.1 glycosyl hydrolase [Methyloversatilis discipulorum]